MKDDVRDLRHARYGLDAEVTEGGDGPGIKVGVCQLAPGSRRNPCVHHELGIRLDAVNATRHEEPVKVIVKAVHIVFGNDGHFATQGQLAAFPGFSDDFGRLILLGKFSIGGNSSPVALVMY